MDPDHTAAAWSLGPALRNRPDGCRVGFPRAADASACILRAFAGLDGAGDPERNLLRSARRDLVVADAQGSTSAFDHLRLSQRLA